MLVRAVKVTKEKRYGTNEFLQNPVIFVQTKTRNYGPTSVEKKDYPDSLRLLPQERNKGYFHEQHIRSAAHFQTDALSGILEQE